MPSQRLSRDLECKEAVDQARRVADGNLIVLVRELPPLLEMLQERLHAFPFPRDIRPDQSVLELGALVKQAKNADGRMCRSMRLQHRDRMP